jgi:Phytanoyl-CoA dioxygenase (PhyH)
MAVAQVAGAVDPASVRSWLEAIDAHPAWRREGAPGEDFNPHSSSLRAVAVEALDLAAIAAALLASEVGATCRAGLGNALACDLDQCWIRRQYAPARYPPGHAAHSWHQDGALGFDFLGATSREGELLSMATCWIALTPCGDDAPGLEFVDADSGSLLPLADLADAAIRARHGKNEFLRPTLAPGDALVFGGGVLHHTHVAATMTNDRTSLELRLFPAGTLPARLRGDRFLPLP